MNYRELSRIAADPAAVRSTARYVKALLGADISDWQAEFLSGMERFEGPDRLSTRQAETLISLRDRASRRSTVRGYEASALVRKLHDLRLDLTEEEEEFVCKLHALGAPLALSDPQWEHVFGLCRRHGLIDDPFIPLH